MSSPVWKVYTADGEYVAACKDAEDAAALVALRPDGATIRYDHKHTVWREGSESQPASASYDHVALVVHERIRVIHERSRDRRRVAQDRYARHVAGMR